VPSTLHAQIERLKRVAMSTGMSPTRQNARPSTKIVALMMLLAGLALLAGELLWERF
jgi:hypothetical protein